jgi:hypothetical protein
MLPGTVLAQSALLARVPLDERIERSSVIFEGRVVDQTSFWNDRGTLIYTAHTIDVYRTFKGEGAPAAREMVTQGGVVGLEAQVAQPSLALSSGDVGLFFAVPSKVSASAKSPPRLEPYAGMQGFIRYDETRGVASDPFRVYDKIETELYDVLAARYGVPEVHVAYRIPSPATAEGSARGGIAPVITGFSPLVVEAGTGTNLTIEGSGFVADGKAPIVLFPDADNGGRTVLGTTDAEIESWSDTQIQVRVPSRAGSGEIRVRTAAGEQASSSLPLQIRYSVVTIEYGGRVVRPALRNRNGHGGYSLKLSTSTSAGGVDFESSAALAPFRRALETWQGSTGFNVKADAGSIDDATVAPNDDNDIVMFDADDASALSAGVLGQAFLGFSSCNGSDWWVTGMDLRFRRNGTGGINWNFGPGGTRSCCFDFESVAVHELGHAHLLGHIIEPGAVMHWQLPNATDARSLTADADIAAGADVLEVSSLFDACGEAGMEPLLEVGIEDSEAVGLRPGLKTPFPNPFSSSTRVVLHLDESETVTVDVVDLLGRLLTRSFEGVVPGRVDYVLHISGTGLPSGIHLIVARGESFTAVRQVVLLR